MQGKWARATDGENSLKNQKKNVEAMEEQKLAIPVLEWVDTEIALTQHTTLRILTLWPSARQPDVSASRLSVF